jgi:hypothetical protein
VVKSRYLTLVFVAAVVLVCFAQPAAAQRHYYLGHEYAKIWINQDGSIDLLYDIGLTLDSGPDINYVNVGQPQGDFTIGEVFDQYGHVLATSDASSGSDYKVQVNLSSALRAGQTVRFNLTTNVARMIYEDEMNPGYVGMEFKPTWWQEASVIDLRVSIVLPSGVTADMVRTKVDWNNTLTDEGDRLAVYWERRDLVPDQTYTFGAAFPKEYVQSYVAAPTWWQRYGPILAVLGVISVGMVGLVYVVRKRPYLIPKVSMETLGVRRGLTAVEASYLLDMKSTMIVTEILYSLLQKRAVWVESATPSLKLKIMEPFQKGSDTAQKGQLRYYEIDAVEAIRKDGTLDEEKLAQAVVFLRQTVEEKMRGYCRKDTVDYYKSVVTKAWEQVERAGTPELASKAYDEQLLWLFLDPNYQGRTGSAFRDRAFEPSPLWLWYWYGYHYYHPHPTYEPNIGAPAQAGKPPTIPGADFANNVASAVEKTSNNFVVSLEKFANAIVPAPAASKASHEPARHGASCVCACAACACACVCVSCACACAGGGVG